MSDEPRYEDIDDSGNGVGQNAIDKKAREPKTKLQISFIDLFPGMKRFPSKAAHKRFRDWEEKTLSGADEAILRRGFFKLRLSVWLKGKNVHTIKIGVEPALSFLENEDEFKNWSSKPEAQKFLKDNKSFGAVVQLHRKTELKDEDV